MKQIYYTKSLEYILKRNNPTIAELFLFITDELNLSYSDALDLVNILLESLIIKCDCETVMINLQ